MNRRKLLVALVAAAFAPTAAAADLSRGTQNFPSKPVRVIVGFAPGGVVDTPARIVAAKLGEIWGTAVVVENRTGAGGSIAAEIAAKAPADGYTLLICNTASHGVNPSFYKKLPYDPVKDFAAISMIGSTPNVFLVHPSAQTTTVSAFIAYAKANPGKVSIGSAGVGTSQHLSMELFKSMTATNIVHVPYKGGASALTDLLGGQVPAIVSGLTTAMTSIKAGKVRALGVTSAKRYSQLPELPTIAESGVPGFEVTAWTGMCAPAALPKLLVAKLNGDMAKALSMSDTQRRLAEQAIDVAPTTPEQFAEFIKSEVAKWAKVVKEAGITLEQ
jgi:tripartite-type tricarboxylate transporter receptor subunit TctC